MRNHHKLIWWKITGVHRLVLVDVTRMFKLIIVLLFFILLYLCEADVSADVFCQVDHVSLLGQHHDESSQRLRVESVHWIFLFFLFRLLTPILNCCKKKTTRWLLQQTESISLYVFICCMSFFFKLGGGGVCAQQSDYDKTYRIYSDITKSFHCPNLLIKSHRRVCRFKHFVQIQAATNSRSLNKLNCIKESYCRNVSLCPHWW